ncbi:hypothetical protein V6Z11_D12G262200 [Gossypium hirsutum]
MEHWDCQAVTGETCSNNDAFISYMENPEFSFGPLSFQHGDEDHLMSFPEVFEPNPNVLDGLMEELYKPFCPELNPYTIPVLEDHVEEPECQKQQPLVVSGTNKDSTKPKRSRKKQQHRVVKHVTADDGLQSDIWSWRKYGQKPIKGSPYPRSYYRCSSSKGCLARKQVERSCSDPRVFIITLQGFKLRSRSRFSVALRLCGCGHNGCYCGHCRYRGREFYITYCVLRV